jgi:hypothetical protein
MPADELEGDEDSRDEGASTQTPKPAKHELSAAQLAGDEAALWAAVDAISPEDALRISDSPPAPSTVSGYLVARQAHLPSAQRVHTPVTPPPKALSLRPVHKVRPLNYVYSVCLRSLCIPFPGTCTSVRSTACGWTIQRVSAAAG